MPASFNTIPSLVNGVSQQPYHVRLPSQLENSINGYPSLVFGMGRRPPTQHVLRIIDGPLGGAAVHTINRDSTERYLVILGNGSCRVFDFNSGAEKTVVASNGFGYLSTNNPSEALRATTVADYTFILNREKVVRKSNLIADTRPFEALVYVRQGNYGRTYTVTVDNTAVTHTTPDGSNASHTAEIATDKIAAELATKLGSTGVSVERIGSTLYLTKASDFTLKVEDGFGGNAMIGVKNRVQSFTELPRKAKLGFVVEVAGAPGNEADNYYVRYESEGVWKETIKPGALTSLDHSTMPHGLIRQPNGTFLFTPLTWEAREVGDDDKTPYPSFTDRPISDVFFYRDRLGFLSDENVVLSRAGKYFNFWPTTATTVVDDDPIDITATNKEITNLLHAVPHNERLIVFAENVQYALTHGDLLTPKTVGLQATTAFPCSTRCRPVGVGQNVFFAADTGQRFTKLREYYLTQDTAQDDAADVTAHVPAYVPSGITKLAANTNENIILGYTPRAPNSLWLYKFQWNGTDKVQSAWDRWQFDSGAEILDLTFISSYLYLVVKRSDGVHVERMDIEPAHFDPDKNYLTHLDRRLERKDAQVIYDASMDETIINLPISLSAPAVILKSGETLHVVSVHGTSVRVTGNRTADDFWIGDTYSTVVTLSTFVPRSTDDTAVTSGRTMVAKMHVNYGDTGAFRVEVELPGRPRYVYPFNAKSPNNYVTGAVALADGTFTLPIAGRNEEAVINIVADTHLPCWVTGVSWEGDFQRRGV